MEGRQRLGCFYKLLLLLEVGCAVVRRGDRAAREWQRAVERGGRAGRAQEPAPLQEPLAKNLGGEALSTAGGVHSGSPARCAHAGSARCPVSARPAATRRHARASLALAACGSHSARTALFVLDETPLCSLACSALIGSLCTFRRISPAPQGAAHPLFPAPSALPGAFRRPYSTRARRWCSRRQRHGRRRRGLLRGRGEDNADDALPEGRAVEGEHTGVRSVMTWRSPSSLVLHLAHGLLPRHPQGYRCCRSGGAGREERTSAPSPPGDDPVVRRGLADHRVDRGRRRTERVLK
jgi:hypothetical protein